MVVVGGLVLAFVGILYLSLRAQLDVNRSLNPARSKVKYAFAVILLGTGLSLIVWFAPCRHLSAWLIGAGVMVFTVATSILGQSWGYVIPELRVVAASPLLAFVAALVLASLRPTCG